MNIAFYKSKARAGSKSSQRVCDAWSPDQPRDADGKWGSGGGGGSGGSSGLSEKGTPFRIHHSGGIHEGTVS
jgi:hypothetical protein